jgi:rod shape-determining protein MreC
VAVYRRSRRHRFLLVLLLLTSVTVITLDQRGQGSGALESARGTARDAFGSVESATSDVFSPVGDFFSGVFSYSDLKAENRRLRARLDQVRSKDVLAAETDNELRQLKANQNLAFASQIPAVAAQVVKTSPSNFQLAVEIDAGSAKGVAVDMPVVTGAGLVGKVIRVSSRRATLLLLTDRTFNVGVRLTNSQDTGAAKGNGPGKPLAIDLLYNSTVIKNNEVVVTSGLEGAVFPGGIPVGRVRTAKAVPSSLQQDVTMEPVVDLQRLSYVKVLQWTPR